MTCTTDDAWVIGIIGRVIARCDGKGVGCCNPIYKQQANKRHDDVCDPRLPSSRLPKREIGRTAGGYDEPAEHQYRESRVGDEIARLPHAAQKPCPRGWPCRNHVACDKQDKSKKKFTPARQECSHDFF